MTASSPTRPQSQETPDGQAAHAGSAVYRKVAVKGSGGVAATVVVTTQQGQVWVSIVPPFTWEAIMEPMKVDELIHMLGLAREAAARSRRPSCGDKAIARRITSGSVASRNKAMGTQKVQS